MAVAGEDKSIGCCVEVPEDVAKEEALVDARAAEASSWWILAMIFWYASWDIAMVGETCELVVMCGDGGELCSL